MSGAVIVTTLLLAAATTAMLAMQHHVSMLWPGAKLMRWQVVTMRLLALLFLGLAIAQVYRHPSPGIAWTELVGLASVVVIGLALLISYCPGFFVTSFLPLAVCLLVYLAGVSVSTLP